LFLFRLTLQASMNYLVFESWSNFLSAKRSYDYYVAFLNWRIFFEWSNDISEQVADISFLKGYDQQVWTLSCPSVAGNHAILDS
jgi:hypothetical protein